MTSIIKDLYDKRIINTPPFVSETHYEVIIGSEAYGVSSSKSDRDIYGFTIPPKEMVFPHLGGEIIGFGRQAKRFEQFQQHHVKHKDIEYDFQIFNIVKFFQLCYDNNPNMIDCLYVPQRCILHCSKIGTLVRDNRKAFLHKGSFHKFRGYAFQQLHKAKDKAYNHIAKLLHKYDITEIVDIYQVEAVVEKRDENLHPGLLKFSSEDLNELYNLFKRGSDKERISPKRLATVMKYGWDCKFGYHIVRLADEAEQILTTGFIDLERNKEMMKAIRNGEMSLEEVEKWFSEKELHLEKLYHESVAVPYSADESVLRNLLLDCLEEYYGNLESSVITRLDQADSLVKQIKDLIVSQGY